MRPETIPLYKRHIRRLLVRSTNWIGDAVMTIPAVRAIRECFPCAEIFILAKPWVMPVFENSPHADRLLIYDSAGKHKGLAGKLRLARELKAYRFDAAILLQNAFEAALITFLAGIPVRIGYDRDARTLLLTHAVHCSPRIKQLHQTEYYLRILKGAGLRKAGNADFDRSLYLRVSDNQKQRADEILAQYGISGNERILGINPGATFGSAKRWFPERYAELCQRLKPFAEKILVFGSPGEEALGRHICETAGSHCVNLCGKTTLGEAIALIGRCRLFVTNDSGLMHIAAALDIPQIAIFGSTDHVTTAPAGSRSRIVRIPTPCSPCLKPECPEKHHRCMKEVTADMVCSLAEQLIITQHPVPSTQYPAPGNMNILIIKLSAIGDVIHTLPALNALRRHYPKAHITWMIEEAAYPLIQGHRALNRILLSKRKRWIKGIRGSSRRQSLKEAAAFIKELRDTRYDLIIDFQQLLKSGVPAAIARGRRKIGYGKGMEHQEHSYVFLNERIPAVSMEIHALTRNMLLLKSLGIEADDIVFDIPVPEHDRHLTEELLYRHGVKPYEPLVAVNPVAKWETKLWSAEKFSELADRLTEIYGVKVIFTGGPEDRDTVEEIMARMTHRAVNLAGETSLKMLAALYEKTAYLISTDTGPMHLAAAMGTPVTAIFGPTAPWRTGPFGSGHQIVRAGLECSPCFKRRCRTAECMARISVADVLEGVRKIKQTGESIFLPPA